MNTRAILKGTFHILILCLAVTAPAPSAAGISVPGERDNPDAFRSRAAEAPLVRSIAPSMRHDPSLEQDCMRALVIGAPWMRGRKIIAIYFRQKNWRITRNEFTGHARFRYMYADALVTDSKNGYCLLVNVLFAQDNRFAGLLFSRTYYRGFMRIEKFSARGMQRD